MSVVEVGPPASVSAARPLRVHVVGNSAAYMVVPAHGSRDGGNYGEQLVGLLAAEGVPATVSHACRWFGMVNEEIARYEQDVRNYFPDVLVLHFGVVECQSNALPAAVVRHFTTWHRTSRLPAVAYRHLLAGRVWPSLRSYQRWASAHDQLTHRLSPRRFTADLRRLVDLARQDCGCLVLLVDIDPVGDWLEGWLPGTGARVRHYNGLLADVASSYTDGVRLVQASAALSAPAGEVPDGLHRTREAHGLTSRLVAREVCEWLRPTGG